MQTDRRLTFLGIAALTSLLLPARIASGTGGSDINCLGTTLSIFINNMSGSSKTVNLTGEQKAGACNVTGQATTYSTSLVCSGTSCSTTVSNLAAGRWAHHIHVDGQCTSTDKCMHQRTIVVDNDGTSKLNWIVFASVFAVTNLNSSGSGSLAQAITNANPAAKPALVHFADTLTGTITLTANLPTITGNTIQLDGVNPNGDTNAITIDANGGGRRGLLIQSSGNCIRGLVIRGADMLGTDTIALSGSGAHNNIIDQCTVQTALNGDDGIGAVLSAGVTNPNFISNNDVSGQHDTGIHIASGTAYVSNNYVHANPNGGIKATATGSIVSDNNFVESNGQSGTTANGIALQSATASIDSTGDISRLNNLRGFSVIGGTATIESGYSCGNSNNGLSILSGGNAGVVGSAFAYNNFNGVTIDVNSNSSWGASNAFMFNALAGGSFRNFDNDPPLEQVENSQWQRCGNGASCNIAAIAADVAGMVDYDPAQAHRAGTPTIVDIVPKRAWSGEIVRIFGTNFNAVESHTSGGTCTGISSLNTCSPVAGNCVQFGNMSATDIIAVTPTMIAVRSPVLCHKPINITVSKLNAAGGTVTSAPFQFCRNDP